MERKRIEKLVVLLLIGILMPVSLFPITIHADTISDSNVHINYYLKSQESYVSGSVTNFRQIYQIDYVFDQNYVGWISSKVVYSMYTDNNLTTAQREFTKSIYVNGGIASITYAVSTTATTSGGAIFSMAQSIQNSNVVPYSEIETLEDILSVLQDVYSMSESIEGISTNQLTELENIVTAVGLSNQYLDSISKLRQWNIPFESYSFVLFMLYQNYDISDFYEYNYLRFPMFYIPNGSELMKFYANTESEFVFIFLVNGNISSTSQLQSAFSIDDGSLIFSNRLNRIILGNTSYSLLKIYARNFTSNGNKTITVVGNKNLVPIYYASSLYSENISTEFALQFNLTNRLLNNLDIIANGTNQSSSASGSLDQTTSQFSDDANDLVTIEESFNDSMNDSLENVSPVFNMGSSFLTSANWVSQQFNRIVNNTPFASLITFGLTLGLGLLIIGKVRK